MERDLRVTMFTMVKDVADEFRVERVEAARLHELRRRVLRNNDPRASRSTSRAITIPMRATTREYWVSESWPAPRSTRRPRRHGPNL